MAEVVPGIHDLIAFAPAPSGLAGALEGLASAFGGAASQSGNLTTLAGGFGRVCNINLN